jgi:hypothetical protein
VAAAKSLVCGQNCRHATNTRPQQTNKSGWHATRRAGVSTQRHSGQSRHEHACAIHHPPQAPDDPGAGHERPRCMRSAATHAHPNRQTQTRRAANCDEGTIMAASSVRCAATGMPAAGAAGRMHKTCAVHVPNNTRAATHLSSVLPSRAPPRAACAHRASQRRLPPPSPLAHAALCGRVQVVVRVGRAQGHAPACRATMASIASAHAAAAAGGGGDEPVVAHMPGAACCWGCGCWLGPRGHGAATTHARTHTQRSTARQVRADGRWLVLFARLALWLSRACRTQPRRAMPAAHARCAHPCRAGRWPAAAPGSARCRSRRSCGTRPAQTRCSTAGARPRWG